MLLRYLDETALTSYLIAHVLTQSATNLGKKMRSFAAVR